MLATSKKQDKVPYDTCLLMTKQYEKLDELPVGCRKYGTIVDKMTQKNLKSRPTDPFAGMRAGAAVEAKRARTEGRETHARMQRRLSTAAERKFSK